MPRATKGTDLPRRNHSTERYRQWTWGVPAGAGDTFSMIWLNGIMFIHPTLHLCWLMWTGNISVPGDTKLLFGGDPTVSVTDMRLQKTYILISTCCYSNCSCNHIHRPELKSSQEVSPCFSWTTYLVHEVLWSHHRLPINISSIPRWNLKMFDSSQFLIVIVKILYLKWVTLSFPLFEPPTWHCWSLKFH